MCASLDMLECASELEALGVKLPVEPPCPKGGSLEDKVKQLSQKVRYAWKRREAVRKMKITANLADQARLDAYAIFWKETATQYVRQKKLYIMRQLYEDSMFVGKNSITYKSYDGG